MKAPTTAELNRLTRTIAARIGRFLQCNGLLEQDAENAYLTGDGIEPGPMDQLIGQPRPRVHLTRYHGVFAPTAESALR